MTLTRIDRRWARRVAHYTWRRDRATTPTGRLAAAVDLLRGWAAEQDRRDRPDRIEAAAAAVARIPYEIEEGAVSGNRHHHPRHGE